MQCSYSVAILVWDERLIRTLRDRESESSFREEIEQVKISGLIAKKEEGVRSLD